MKKFFRFSKKHAYLSVLLCLAMLMCMLQGAFTASADETGNTNVNSASWADMSDFAVTNKTFASAVYAKLDDPCGSGEKVLALHAQADQHNHIAYARVFAFNDGTDYIKLAAGKYTVSYKYYLKTLSENFYTASCSSGSCAPTVAAYNDSSSSANTTNPYRIYFGVTAEADFSTNKFLTSKSNALFNYEAAKTIDFENEGWQESKVSFIVTQTMVDAGTNIFAMYSANIGHTVYLKDVNVSQCTAIENGTGTYGDASEYGLISDFTNSSTLPATKADTAVGNAVAAAISVGNANNSFSATAFTTEPVVVNGVTQSALNIISKVKGNRATSFNTGFVAKDFLTLKNGEKYKISFDLYNPNYASFASNTVRLSLVNLQTASTTASSTELVQLVSDDDLKADSAKEGYVNITKEFEFVSDEYSNILALSVYSLTADANAVFYIDNIKIDKVVIENTAEFYVGNSQFKEVNYGDTIKTPSASDVSSLTKAGNISGWRDVNGDVYDLNAVIPKEIVALLSEGLAENEKVKFTAVYDSEITFTFEDYNSKPANVSSSIALLDRTGIGYDNSTNCILLKQTNSDRHFLPFGKDASGNLQLASYERYRTYSISFKYKCTQLAPDENTYFCVALGVGNTEVNCYSKALYRINLTKIEVTDIGEWKTFSGWFMAPNNYDEETDGRYIGLGITNCKLSTAEAEENTLVYLDNVTIIGTDFMLGDVDNSKVIDYTDYSALRTNILDGTVYNEATNISFDVAKDNSIDIVDLVKLKKYLVANGIIN